MPTQEETFAEWQAFFDQHPELKQRMSHFTASTWHRLRVAGIDPRRYVGVGGIESDYSRQARLDDERNAQFMAAKRSREQDERDRALIAENNRLRRRLGLPRKLWGN